MSFDGRRNAGMAAADDQHIRVAALVGGVGLPLLEPVRAGEIAHVESEAGRATRVADLVEVEQGRNRPSLRHARGLAQQPERADARAVDGLEG